MELITKLDDERLKFNEWLDLPIKVARDSLRAALYRIKELEEREIKVLDKQAKENMRIDAALELKRKEIDALRKTVEIAEILIKRYEAEGGPLK